MGAGCSQAYIFNALASKNGKETPLHILTAVIRNGLNSGSLTLVKGCYRESDPAKKKPKVEKEETPKKRTKTVVKKKVEKARKKNCVSLLNKYDGIAV